MKLEFARMSGPLPYWVVRKNRREVGRIRGYQGKGAVLELYFMHANPGSSTNPHLLGCENVNDAKRKARELLNPAVGPEDG